jgi:hypothetical protein
LGEVTGQEVMGTWGLITGRDLMEAAVVGPTSMPASCEGV